MNAFLSTGERIGFAGLLLWLCSFALQATASTGLTGTLTDPRGQVISDATIHLLRRADSSRHETKTDAEGRFHFASLDAGEYRVTAESPGFAVITRTITVQGDGQ